MGAYKLSRKGIHVLKTGMEIAPPESFRKSGFAGYQYLGLLRDENVWELIGVRLPGGAKRVT